MTDWCRKKTHRDRHGLHILLDWMLQAWVPWGESWICYQIQPGQHFWPSQWCQNNCIMTVQQPLSGKPMPQSWPTLMMPSFTKASSQSLLQCPSMINSSFSVILIQGWHRQHIMGRSFGDKLCMQLQQQWSHATGNLYCTWGFVSQTPSFVCPITRHYGCIHALYISIYWTMSLWGKWTGMMSELHRSCLVQTVGYIIHWEPPN